jgi:GNAT superfamily N-acetyltransferase
VALIDNRLIALPAAASPDNNADRRGCSYQVYVELACWRRGIGSGLLRHVVRDLQAHGFSHAALWVISVNAPARAFAEKHGWRPDGASRFEDCGGSQVEQVRYRHTLG